MYDETASAVREAVRELQSIRLEISRVRDELYSLRLNQPAPPVRIDWSTALMLCVAGAIAVLTLLFVFGFTIYPPAQ
jgi:hypothetical protein